MKKVDRRIVIVGAFIFIVGMAYGIMKFLIAQKEDPFMRSPVEAKRYVKTEKVKYKTIISPVSAPGRVNSVSEVDLMAEAAGKILVSDIPLKKGAEFSKGDILFTIYPDEAILALKSRKSKFLSSLANFLPDIKIDFPEKEPQLREFFNSININKKLPDFPEIENEKLKIFLSAKNILSEYYGILKDELQLKRYTLTAPFNGTYSDVYLEAGTYTNPGGKVAHTIQTDILEIEVPLERFDAEWVKTGDEVTLNSKTRDKNWKAKVVRKSKFVDEKTQSQSIFIKVENTGKNQILSGEYLNAVFSGHPVKNVMEIPRNAVFNTNEVFIVSNQRLQKKKINIIKLNEKSLIFNGLNEGEILVMQPLINVMEGTLVEIQKQEIQAKNAKKVQKKPKKESNQ